MPRRWGGEEEEEEEEVMGRGGYLGQRGDVSRRGGANVAASVAVTLLQLRALAQDPKPLQEAGVVGPVGKPGAADWVTIKRRRQRGDFKGKGARKREREGRGRWEGGLQREVPLKRHCFVRAPRTFSGNPRYWHWCAPRLRSISNGALASLALRQRT
jgi:hypothetical protein